MHYADDELRVPYVDLLPVVTKKFFNDDDNYEVAVGFAVNSTTPGINHYRTVAYSIGGDKDSKGNSAAGQKVLEYLSRTEKLHILDRYRHPVPAAQNF